MTLKSLGNPLRYYSLPACTVGLLGVARLTAIAQEEELGLDRNRVTIGARFTIGMSADFHVVGYPVSVPQEYDDGFVRTDISGNAGGRTWYWGYNRNEQLIGNEIEMHALRSAPGDGTSRDASGDPQAGFEVNYGRELGRLSLGRNRSAPWGVQIGFGSLDVNLKSDSSFAGTVPRTTGVFSLGGVIPPQAPYAGTFEGPGPTIGASPIASHTDLVDASSSISGKLDGMVLGFKFGPFIEIPITKHLSLNLSAGGAVVDALMDFSISETVTIAGVVAAPLHVEDKISQNDWLFGLYGEATLSYELTHFLEIYFGGQYQVLGDSTISGSGHEAVLHLDKGFEIVAGIERRSNSDGRLAIPQFRGRRLGETLRSFRNDARLNATIATSSTVSWRRPTGLFEE